VYYIVYRKNGRLIEEKAGRQFQDDMTPARASGIRTRKIEGDKPTNGEEREAQAAAKEAVVPWTIDSLWEEYKRQRIIKGIVQDENRYAKHIKPLLAGKEPEDLVPLDVDRLRRTVSKTHKPQTTRNVLALLRRIVNFGTEKRLCAGANFTIKLPPADSEKTEDLTPDELSRLLEAIEHDSHVQAGNLMKMALFTGMRRGQLFRLQWTDLDFERGFIHLRDTKGGKDRIIPMNAEARKILESHQRTVSPFVFPGRSGQKRVDIHKTLNRIKGAADLPKEFRALHGLRHVYASMLASSGKVDMYTLQKLLTHRSPQMTQRYAHLRDESLRAASDLAGSIIEQAANGKGKDVIRLTERTDA
jgi:integrase